MNGTAPARPTATAKRRALRELLARDEVTVMPGGFGPLYARMAQEAGFESFFVAGSQLAAFLYGYPDVGVLGLRDVVDHVRHVASATDIPIMVDGDTGYGNAVNVTFAVRELVRSGVAAVQIEDQEAPKKSGTVSGRRLISRDEAVGKYRAAVLARDELDPEFVVCARCDAIGAEGGTFADAVDRCVAYVEEGGADFVWLNTVQSREQLAEACARIPAPVLAIWGGPDPAPTLAEYARLGVRIVLHPVVAARAGAQAAWELLHELRRDGPPALDRWRERIAAGPWGPVPDKALLGTDRLRDLEELVLPAALRRDYETTFGHRTMEGQS
ncbi:isocitrate lyase/PEP mutase family protein [Phytohabitans kaempferiae]|uniref:Oxaloacetate decarboxylase n=1 Tax=Phytohabitans kaempferiae TaxID=1620943 RepID=A0ABV6LYX6_9ACTN